ncbi:MAG TPA: permease-like cell division protein FtsX [Acidimicrobiales bacterium]|jgi:cell division transport system permease protein|nr:permease-like cell division protein FtsX [Acidimicrobiales bacterium]
MGLSVDYIARETSTNLWRNRMMTAAAVLTVAVSLAFVGASLLLKQGVQVATERWRGDVTMAIFLNPNVTSNQVKAIGSELAADPLVKTSVYYDHQRSYQEMRQLYRNEPDLVNSVTPADLPPSYRVTLRDASQVGAVSNQFRGQPGVLTISTPAEAVKTLIGITNVLQAAGYAVALILLVAALVLILNTIRMAIFARRREIGVMKLVGATNWFIRIPFMLEGFVEGLLGGFIACLAVVFVRWAVGNFVNHYKVGLIRTFVVSSHDVFMTMVLVLVVGAVVGAAASMLAVRRFLEV